MTGTITEAIPCSQGWRFVVRGDDGQEYDGHHSFNWHRKRLGVGRRVDFEVGPPDEQIGCVNLGNGDCPIYGRYFNRLELLA